MLVMGTCGTEAPFLSESELPESARLSWTKSASTLENEAAIDNLGEDAGLAKAIEESLDQTKSNNFHYISASSSPIPAKKSRKH